MKGILNSAYPSELEHYLERQAADPEYPLVSLFNLDQVFTFAILLLSVAKHVEESFF